MPRKSSHGPTMLRVKGFTGKAVGVDLYDTKGALSRIIEEAEKTRFKMSELDSLDFDIVLAMLVSRGALETSVDYRSYEIDTDDLWLPGMTHGVVDIDEVVVDVQRSTVDPLGLDDVVTHEVILLFPAKILTPRTRSRR